MKTEKIVKYDVNIGIWDTAGSEKYKSIAPMYFRDADVGIIVIDATRPESDENAHYWINELLEKGKKDVSILIDMNKVDMASTSMDDIVARAETFTEKYGGKYVLTSAKNGDGIDTLFDLAYADIKQKLDEREQEQKMQNTPQETKSSSCC